MKQTFNVLDNYNVPLYEEETFRQLLDNINSPNKYLKTEVNICISGHSASFHKDSTYPSTVTSRLLRETQSSTGRYGRSQQVNSSGRGGRGGRCSSVWRSRRVRVKGNRNQSKNGVNIINPTRWYGKEEWSQLICNIQQYILKDPAIEQAVNERHSNKSKTTNTTASFTTNKVSPEHNRLVAVIINGVRNSSWQKKSQ